MPSCPINVANGKFVKFTCLMLPSYLYYKFNCYSIVNLSYNYEYNGLFVCSFTKVIPDLLLQCYKAFLYLMYRILYKLNSCFQKFFSSSWQLCIKLCILFCHSHIIHILVCITGEWGWLPSYKKYGRCYLQYIILKIR